MPWPKPTVMVSNGPQREPGVSVRPRSFSSICDLVEEAHLLEQCFLPRRADLVGDLRRADVGAFHHDLGDRAGAAKRMGVVDDMAVDMQRIGAIIDLAERS